MRRLRVYDGIHRRIAQGRSGNDRYTRNGPSKHKTGIGKFLELKGRVLPTICIMGDLVFESIIPQYEELIDEMAKRAPNPHMADRIKALREVGFEFDKIQENLAKAGSGTKTRIDS